MNSIVKLIFIILFFAHWSCSKSQDLKSRWHSNAYKQGMENIPALDYYYNNDCRVFYLISNDEKNLYINARFTEKSQQMMVLQSGLTIWIDTTGKTKTKLGVRYPLTPHDDFAGMKERSSRDYPGTEAYLEQPPPLPDIIQEIELLGFDGKKSSRIISANDSLYIHGNMVYNEYNDLLYEICIPFRVIKYNGPLLSIGFEVNNTFSEQQSPGNPPSGGRGPGGSPPGGGFSQGGSPPGGGFPQGGPPLKTGDPGHGIPEQNISEIKFWAKKIQLAVK